MYLYKNIFELQGRLNGSTPVSKQGTITHKDVTFFIYTYIDKLRTPYKYYNFFFYSIT